MKTLTYGTLPTREEFEAAFEEGDGFTFNFTNDPRVGTCELTCAELWAEIGRACAEWRHGQPGCVCDANRQQSGDHRGCWEAAGQWCSGVLGVLGFEWV